VIAKTGHPLVKVVALSEVEATAQQRIGFMAGQVVVPDDLDSMGREQIENGFLGLDAPWGPGWTPTLFCGRLQVPQP
jgi:antitoxin (DNA-binding transcriptional repressor) of toxin-antitoxin stability system